jgi:phosphoribosyl-ATP pyrophosphohydrolase/phosphoribosyl-AMP cyclohydrolase
MNTSGLVDAVRFDERGIAPAVVQDAGDGTVLMLGYMNREALERTLSSREIWFWSRSRGELWHKGATSGNIHRVVEVRIDCDGDTLLVKAVPDGPTCHTGTRACFAKTLWATNDFEPSRPSGGAVLDTLFETIEGRRSAPEPGSYTNHLLNEGVDRIGRKIGEESAEVIIAAKNSNTGELTSEVADLFYHTLVLLSAQGIALDDVGAELSRRESAPRRHKE